MSHYIPKPPQPVDTPWLTKTDASIYMRTSPATIDRWTRDGLLIKHKVGGTQAVRFHKSDLDAIMIREDDATFDDIPTGYAG